MNTFAKTMHPITFTAGAFRAIGPRQISRLLRPVALCLVIVSIFSQAPFAYLCVTIPVLLAPFLWVNSGAFGIPVLPVLSALFYVYYAIPLITGSTLEIYTPEQKVWAALSVGLFLTTASFASWPFLGAPRSHPGGPGSPMFGQIKAFTNPFSRHFSTKKELIRLIFIGLAGGILFSELGGSLGVLGSFLGVVRAVIMTLSSLACYLIGFGRGSGLLTGRHWAMALAGFVTVTALAISSLLLVNGAMNVIGIVLGYVLASKRIPWLTIALTLAIVTVLQAGKYNMRSQYWAPGAGSLQSESILRLPGVLIDWFVAGLGSVGGAHESYPTLLERTSLLHMVLTVQQSTPEFLPYLDGETYLLLPSMLMPRFLNPDKLESQAGINLLSVYYGLQRAEDTGTTTLGWGLVAEAYANLGNIAVIVVGAVFGLLCGALMRLSAAPSPVSPGMLVTISCTLILCNLEADFSFLFLTLLQTIGAILLFLFLPKVGKRRSAPAMRYVQRS